MTGAANTADVAFLITTGAVDIGLRLSDRRQGRCAPKRSCAPGGRPGILTNYAVAVNAKAVSPNAQALVNVMRSSAGRDMLRTAGLEAS